ncbi:MAG: hypothetical protein RI988_2049 [Pseudomonadota bacterium]|jgi:hypothetical protein
MADAVASQILFEGDRKVIMKFTNLSDGTGEVKIAKVLPASLAPSNAGKACTAVTITKIYAMTHGMEVAMYWGATADVLIALVPQNTNYVADYESFGGLWNNAGAGKTGNVLFSTVDQTLGDAYTIILEMVKTYAA